MEKKRATRKDKFTAEPKKNKDGTLEKSKSTGLLGGFIIAVLGFILYSNTLNHGYTLDDYSVILENRVTKQGIAAIPEIFKTSYRYGYHFTSDDLYRPVVKAMFAAEWDLGKQSPKAGHWMNVLFYALTGWILYFSLLRISKGNVLFAFISAALFIAHPVHTEVVASIKSRDEILAFLFSIWALERYITSIRNRKTSTLITAAALYLIALLSKESAITFLAVFPLTAWFFTDEKPVDSLKKLIPVASAAFLFLIIRAAVLSGATTDSVSVADNLLMAAKDPVTRFCTAVLILGLYLKLLVFPHPLVFDYSFNQIPLVNAADPYFIAAAMIHLSLLVFAIKTLKSKNLFAFSILYYFITISIFSNIFITIGSSMGERFLYAPSLGFCMAVALGISKLAGSVEKPADASMQPLLQPKLLIPLSLLLVAYSFKTFAQNPVWKNNYTLYSDGVKNSPNSTRTHYYLGNYLVKPEVWEGKSNKVRDSILYKGIGSLKKSIEIYPYFADAFTQMGVAYYKMNKLDSAMICYQGALKLNPGYATIHNNIGTVYFSTGNYPEALKAFLKATQQDPRYAEAHANAGSAYGMMQQYDNALSSLFQAIKWDPNYAQAYFFIGITYQFKGDKANSDAYLAKAYKLDPSLKKN